MLEPTDEPNLDECSDAVIIHPEEAEVPTESQDPALTTHVSNVLEGSPTPEPDLEEAKKAVSDLKVIIRALKVLITVQCSYFANFLRGQFVKYTNNEQLLPLRIFVKHKYGLLSKNFDLYLRPYLKTHGKILLGSGLVLLSWLIFYILYCSLFNFNFLEHSYEGDPDLEPIMGPFYKRHVSKNEKVSLQEKAMKKHRFNSFLSDQTSVNRRIPDTRSPG